MSWEINIVQYVRNMNDWVWSNGGMVLTEETEVLGEEVYRGWVVVG